MVTSNAPLWRRDMGAGPSGIIIDSAVPAQQQLEADQYWDDHPTFFEDDSPFKTKVMIQLLRHIVSGPITAVLDIGCGSGKVLYDLSSTLRTSTRTGCDLSLRALQRAVKRDGNATFVMCDATNLPFASRSFDLALLCDVLEHCSAPDAVLKEALRVAHMACIKMPCERNLWTAWRIWRRHIPADYYRVKYGHLKAYSFWDIKRWLESFGTICAIQSVPLKKHEGRWPCLVPRLPYAVIFGGFTLAVIKGGDCD